MQTVSNESKRFNSQARKKKRKVGLREMGTPTRLACSPSLRAAGSTNRNFTPHLQTPSKPTFPVGML